MAYEKTARELMAENLPTFKERFWNLFNNFHMYFPKGLYVDRQHNRYPLTPANYIRWEKGTKGWTTPLGECNACVSSCPEMTMRELHQMPEGLSEGERYSEKRLNQSAKEFHVELYRTVQEVGLSLSQIARMGIELKRFPKIANWKKIFEAYYSVYTRMREKGYLPHDMTG